MNFFDLLRSWFIKAANVFLHLALDAYGWPLVGGWLGDGFAALVDFASECAYALWRASNWYEDTIELLQDILSWTNIKNLIRGWLEGIESVIEWFGDWWTWVGGRIDYWWDGVKSTVQDMIDAATQGIDELRAAWDNFWTVTWPGILDDIEGLGAAWTNFWNITFPTLVSFAWLTTWWNSRLADISALIDSAFTLRESLWAGCQEIVSLVLVKAQVH
ncbi:hypothetical protein ES708_21105 [subsurface metagenome]